MALPLLLALTEAARVAYPIIRAGVAEGLSANAIGRVLKTQGLGIRRQTLLDIVRAETGVQRAQAALKFVGLDRLPNPARLPEALTRIRRRYAFTVRVVGNLVATGEQIIQHITVSTDTILTRRQLEQQAESAILDNQLEYGIDIVSSVLTGGVRAGAAGVL